MPMGVPQVHGVLRAKRGISGIASAESILSEANVPRNATACRIATHPSGARNDRQMEGLGCLSLFLGVQFDLDKGRKKRLFSLFTLGDERNV